MNYVDCISIAAYLGLRSIVIFMNDDCEKKIDDNKITIYTHLRSHAI